ncbi:hypothetical protein [Paenibacillus sp. SI8]|uniref:hypothetical protein n=1 Tax=unclassified Paenibacillus TaxID=185978 RepID=UPI0034662D1B
MMFILLKGSGRQATYMETLYQATSHSALFQFGLNFPMVSVQKTYAIVERSDESRHDYAILRTELQLHFDQLLQAVSCDTIFVHGDFMPGEIPVLKELGQANAERFSLIVSIQDDFLPSGKIIIEETEVRL